MDLPTLKPWQRRLAYGAFGALAFLFALQRTFPSEAVKERLVLAAAAQGWQLSVTDIGPGGFPGVHATGVTLESQEGTRIAVDELDASLRLWPLLLGRRGVSFDARVYDGRVKGVTEEGRGASHLAFTASGIDLAKAAALKKASGLDLSGTLSAEVDVTLDAKDAAKSSGHGDLTVERAALNGGTLQLPSMGGGLTLPRVGLGAVTGHAVVRDGKATVEKLEVKGEDLEANTDNLYFVVQPRLEYAPLYGAARVKLADAFFGRPGTSGFKSVLELALAQAKRRDGAYGFQIYGTLGHPQARPSAQ
ncbi:MAG TPA: type II secretion system protein GspN [Anaeromyxobacteraceae bacterium]|jgi:type II secretion system protein N|nr:type II secretion system protein GspN [Anaeromyxobacteraceae bacterium]